MSLEGVLVGSQQCVDELKQLHHSLVLTEVLVTFEEEHVLTTITACGGEGEGRSREREQVGGREVSVLCCVSCPSCDPPSTVRCSDTHHICAVSWAAALR